MRDLPRTPRQRERSPAAGEKYQWTVPGVPRSRFPAEEARVRACNCDFQRQREAAGRLFCEEQSRGAAPEVRARTSGGRPPGLRCGRSHRYYQDKGADQLPVVPPAALFGSGRSADQGSAQQFDVLFQLSQRSDAEIVMRKMNTKWKDTTKLSLHRNSGVAVIFL